MCSRKSSKLESIFDVESQRFEVVNDNVLAAIGDSTRSFLSTKSEDFIDFEINIGHDDEIYISSKTPYCHKCKTHHVHKHTWTKRTLIFKDMGKVTVNVKRYRCVDCGKTFSTNLSKIVRPNANFTNEFRDGMREIFGKLFLSLNKSSELYGYFHDVNISHQSVQNMIIETDTTYKVDRKYFSKFYIFDDRIGLKSMENGITCF